MQDSNRTAFRQAVTTTPGNERDFQALAFARENRAWYVARVMPPSVGLRLAAIGAVSGALIVSCGTDRIDLLPPIQAQGGSGQAGSSSVSSAGEGGHDPSGSAGAPTSNSGGANGGGSGGGCAGEACGGFTFGGAGHCDPEHEQCSGCWRDEHCPEGKYCAPFFGGVCVECVENEDCDAGYACEQASGECMVACEDSDDCSGKRCDTELGLCVECLDDFDCDGTARGYCDWTRRRCVECVMNAHCAEGGGRVCVNGGWCAECYDDSHCGSGRHCNPNGYCED